MINSLFTQTMDFQSALIEFRQNVSGKASNEQIAIAFDTLDRKLTAILGEVQFLEKDLPALKMVCNKLKSAEHDLHFAVFSGDGNPRQPEALYRQTLAQEDRVASLASNVNWVFARRDELQGWKDDLDAVQKSLVGLQKLQEGKKGTADQIKEQFIAADNTWNQVVQKYEAAKQNKLLLQSFVVLVDQGFGWVAPLAGVKDRRARRPTAGPTNLEPSWIITNSIDRPKSTNARKRKKSTPRTNKNKNEKACIPAGWSALGSWSL